MAPGPPWRVPPFDAAVAELEQYVRATWSPLGIVVSGSIVRGNPEVEALARHVLGADTFFDWSSAREPVALD